MKKSFFALMLAAVLPAASKKARDVTTTKLNRKKLEKSLPALRELTRQDPEVFPQRLYDILLDCGVVLVGLPALPNANLNGATIHSAIPIIAGWLRRGIRVLFRGR